MTRKYPNLARLMPPAALLLFLGGCASMPPPVGAMDQASASLDAARSAGASDHAPLELAAAEGRLQLAQAAMGKQDYEDALRLAAESQVNSAVARAKADLASQRQQNLALGAENTRLRDQLLDAAGHDDSRNGGGA